MYKDKNASILVAERVLLVVGAVSGTLCRNAFDYSFCSYLPLPLVSL